MLKTFPNSIWIESYGQNTVTVRSCSDPRFFQDIWRSNRWISVILMPICSLACWLQLCCWPHCEIPSGLGVMIFQSRTALEIWVPLFLAAARVYALNSLPRTSRLVFLSVFHLVDMLYDPVDWLHDSVEYPGALCTVHPAHACALRALLPHHLVDMFALGLRNLSTGFIQSTTSSTQSTARTLLLRRICMIFGFFSFLHGFAWFSPFLLNQHKN